MIARLDRFRARLRDLAQGAALILNPVDVGYLSGFTGSTAALLVTPSEARFLTDSRYTVQAHRECVGWTVAVTQTSSGYDELIADQARLLGLRELAVEADYLTVARHEVLHKRLPDIQLHPVEDLAAPLRRIKDAGELAHIRAACALADRAFDYVLNLLRPGVAERDIAAELEYWMKRHGSEKEAFDTIVASGVRSSLPHGRASSKLLELGDLITFDFGARIEGYSSDLTRTVVLGPASDRQREVYGIVLEAELAAIAAIRPGASCRDVDAVARDLIAARGFGQNFGHGLGHGLGRSTHDHVAFSPRSTVVLEPGMVVTVEPGIYLDGWGGVRIEDDVVVTEHGCEILTHAPKALIQVPV